MSAPAGRWPLAALGPIARARVLAATVPSAASVEGVLDAPYDVVWPWVADLEHSVPRFDAQVRALRVLERRPEGDAEALHIRATSMGMRLPFDVRLENGFCLMQARLRLYLVVMAAEPADDGAHTRFFHMEAVPLPGTGRLRGYLQRAVAADFRNLRRLASSGF